MVAALRDAQREALDATLGLGQPVYLDRSEYLPVDSIVGDEEVGRWDVDRLVGKGLSGWRVVGVVPRTIGVGFAPARSGHAGLPQLPGVERVLLTESCGNGRLQPRVAQ